MAKEVICANCLAVGKPKNFIKGNFLTELVLWLLLIVPGLLYSLWRLNTRAKVCRECGSDQIIPANSPRGKKLLEERYN